MRHPGHCHHNHHRSHLSEVSSLFGMDFLSSRRHRHHRSHSHHRQGHAPPSHHQAGFFPPAYPHSCHGHCSPTPGCYSVPLAQFLPPTAPTLPTPALFGGESRWVNHAPAGTGSTHQIVKITKKPWKKMHANPAPCSYYYHAPSVSAVGYPFAVGGVLPHAYMAHPVCGVGGPPAILFGS